MMRISSADVLQLSLVPVTQRLSSENRLEGLITSQEQCCSLLHFGFHV